MKPTTHNPQPTTHNPQPTTHNPLINGRTIAKWTGILILLTFFIGSCNKDRDLIADYKYSTFKTKTSAQRQFFKHGDAVLYPNSSKALRTNTTVDTMIWRLFTVLQAQDSAENFMPDFIRSYGIPRWDKAIFGTSHNVYVIPIAHDSLDFLTSVLFIWRTGDKYQFKLNVRDHAYFPERWTPLGNGLATFYNFLSLDYSVFGFIDTLMIQRWTPYLQNELTENSNSAQTRCSAIISWQNCTPIFAFHNAQVWSENQGNKIDGGNNLRNFPPCPVDHAEEILHIEVPCDELWEQTHGWGTTYFPNTPGGNSNYPPEQGGSGNTPPYYPPAPDNWWEEESLLKRFLGVNPEGEQYYEYLYQDIQWLSEVIRENNLEKKLITLLFDKCDPNNPFFRKCMKDYLVDELDIPNDIKDCLKKFEYSVIKEVNDYIKDNSIKDPCQPNKSSKELLKPLLEAACADNNFDGYEAEIRKTVFRNILKNMDHINLPKKVNDICPKFYCIAKKMMDGSLGTNFVCELLGAFQGLNDNSPNFNMLITVEEFGQSSKYGFTNTNAFAGVKVARDENHYIHSILGINSNKCNNMEIVNVFETLQHEFIHLDIKRRLIKDYGWDPLDNSTESQLFHQLVMFEYGGQAGQNDHFLMLEHYTERMVQSIIEMNNGVGTYDDFIGLVLNGFPIEVLNYCGITYAQVAEHLDRFYAFIANPGNLNSQLSACE